MPALSKDDPMVDDDDPMPVMGGPGWMGTRNAGRHVRRKTMAGG
jgi:hypothetical protein